MDSDSANAAMSSASPRLSDSFCRRAVSTATDVLCAFAEAAISSVRLAVNCLSACEYSDCAEAESSVAFCRSSSAELVANLESEVPDSDAVSVLACAATSPATTTFPAASSAAASAF